jgi:ribosomal-protein-alanine N-acetyltransferase
MNTMTEVNSIKLESSRLYLKPLTFDQMVWYKDSDQSLEKELGLMPYPRVLTDQFIIVIETSNLPYVQFNPEKILFGTVWVIIHKEERKIIGDIGFKGAPSDRGLVEVGYGIYMEYRNRGFMTEALNSLTEWAFKQPDVKIILAETDKKNLASQRTLTKSNFSPFAETDQNYWWRLDNDLVN